MEVRTALSVRAPRVAERRKKHMSRHHRSRLRGFGTPREVGRDARARARERSGRTFTMVAGVQLSARLFTGCVEQRGSNADRRAFYRRRHTAAEKVSKYTQYSTSSDRKTLYKIYGLRFLIVPAVHPTFSNACVRVAAGRESLGPRMKSHASRLCKSAHLRRRLCHPAGAFRTHAPSNADARDVRQSPRRVGARVALARESRAARSAWAPPPPSRPRLDPRSSPLGVARAGGRAARRRVGRARDRHRRGTVGLAPSGSVPGAPPRTWRAT